MRRLIFGLLAALLLVPVSLLTGAAQDATPSVSPAGGDSLLAELGYPEIRVTTDGTTHDFPTELEAGRYHVVLENFRRVSRRTPATPSPESGDRPECP